MRVGVEEAVLEDLLHVGVEQHRGDLRPVDARGGDGVVVAELDRRDVLERQHAPGA